MTQPDSGPVSPRRRVATFLVALGWTLLFLLIGILMAGGAAAIYGRIFGPAGDRLAILSKPGPGAILVQGVCAIVGFGIATWLIGIKASGLTWRDLRWQVGPPRLSSFGLGLALGILPAAIALLLAIAAGGARFSPDAGGFTDYLRQTGLTLLVLAPAALSEEIIFRGVPLVLLARPLGRLEAVVILSLLFAAAHLFNPHVEPLAVANIALAGGFLAAAFYLPGGMWTAFGAHLGWNFTLAAADAPVSGLPFTIPWINYLPGGPEWVTGGAFGPEGGLVASVAIVLGLSWTIRHLRREDS